MTVRAKFRDEKLDPVDAEQIQEMLESPGWKHVKRGLENLRDTKMRDLVRQHTEVETARIRGEIGTAETALAMPEALMAEARKGGKTST